MALIILAHQILPLTGGTERYIYELACALQDRGEELVVIATDCEGAADFDSGSPLTIERVPAEEKSNDWQPQVRGKAAARWRVVQALAAAATDCVNRNSGSK